jgi:hypothetical protein
MAEEVRFSAIQGTYTHIQTTPAIVWEIAHLLGTSYPIVDVWVDDNGTERRILPERVRAINAATVEITFSTATAGRATII